MGTYQSKFTGAEIDQNIEKIKNTTVPTKTSELTNDSEFTTKNYVDGLVGDIETLLQEV